jgi:cell division protein DivIC
MKNYLPKSLQKYSFYIYTLFFFLVWLIFFDRSNLLRQISLWKTISDLEKQTAFYDKELEKVKEEELEVMGSKLNLEKFAREKYLMKKENETVFVLVDKNGKLIEEED